MNIKESIKLKGEIIVPGDKSISHRSIIFGSIANGTTVIKGLLESEDCLNTINAFIHMGVNIKKDQANTYSITGVGLNGLKEPNQVINCGNSGTTMRLLTGILSAQGFYSVLYGDQSLSKRPMRRVIDPLTKMGATIWSRNGLPPITINGSRLNGLNYQMPVASAQVKSAILLAGLFTEEEVRIVQIKKSRNHTELMLRKFGVDIIEKDNIIILPSGKKNLTAQEINVPGDISSAAFFIVGALITLNSSIIIKNVGINPSRSGILDVIRKMGGEITLENIKDKDEEITADINVRYQKLSNTIIEGELIPRLIDEIPIISLLASQAKGKTIIRNAEELRVKESDRIKTIISELSKIGVVIEELEDGLIITGPSVIKGAKVSSHFDHRIAMTLLIANVISQGEIEIDDVDCINTSYPNFTEVLESIKEREIKE